MADAVIQTPSRKNTAPVVSRGPVGTLFHGLLRFAIWLLLGLLGNILMEWLCMGLLWPEEGFSRSQKLLEAEIQYLEQDLQESLLTEQPTRFAVGMASQLNGLLFQKTGIVKAVALTRL